MSFRSPPPVRGRAHAPRTVRSVRSRFQMGNVTARPTSRIANTVSVFATAHNAPASSAHTIKCFFSARSANTYPVPFSRVGKLQRAVKTPATMHSEIANGEKPAFTSFVGASAAPSHTPAVKPQITPKPCNDNALFSTLCVTPAIHHPCFSPFASGRCSVQHDQESDPGQQYKKRHQKVAVRRNRFYSVICLQWNLSEKGS